MPADIALATDHGQPVDKKKLILIVDDEVDITTTFAILFELHGFDTATASNGVEALEFLAKRSADLVISDCMMPFMDGVEMLKTLRAMSITRSIPCILMSGAPERHDLSSTKFDRFLQKPFQFEALMFEVNKLLKIEKKS